MLALGLGVTGCGSGTDTVDRANAATLHDHVATARTALARSDEAAVRRAVEDFRAAVERLTRDRALNAGDAKVLLTQADRIADDIERQATAEKKDAATTAAAAQAAKDAAAWRDFVEEDTRGGQQNGKEKQKKKEKDRDDEDDDD